MSIFKGHRWAYLSEPQNVLDFLGFSGLVTQATLIRFKDLREDVILIGGFAWLKKSKHALGYTTGGFACYTTGAWCPYAMHIGIQGSPTCTTLGAPDFGSNLARKDRNDFFLLLARWVSSSTMSVVKVGYNDGSTKMAGCC